MRLSVMVKEIGKEYGVSPEGSVELPCLKVIVKIAVQAGWAALNIETHPKPKKALDWGTGLQRR
jgi:hypothetical protein